MRDGRPRVAAFVDGSNLYFTQRDTLGWRLDWKRFRAMLEELGEVTLCIYYTGRSQTDHDGSQHKFLHMLANNGFSISVKDIKTVFAEDGTPVRKANLDVELVLDMLNQIDNYDTAVLVSGDGDFERALRVLRDRGKQIRVISTQGKVAEEIRWLAGPDFLDLQDYRDELELR